jgi:hypothetical protein
MSSKYSPEERAAMLAESRATLARGLEPQTEEPEDTPVYVPPPPEDRVAKWKREADEREREYEQGARELRRQKRETERRAEEAAMLKQQQEQARNGEAELAMLTALNATLKALASLDDRLERVERLLKASNNSKPAEITDLPGPFLRPRLVS